MRGVPVNGGEVLRLRRSLVLTQERLAAAADCDVKTVRKAEKSQHVDHSVLNRLAEALGVSSENLVDSRLLGQEQANTDTILQWQEAFNERDVEQIVSFYDRNAFVEVVFNDQIPGGGLFQGIDAIRDWVTLALGTYQTQHITPDMFEIDGANDLVFMRSVRPAEVRIIATGATTTAQAAHEFRLAQGLVIAHRIFSDTEKISQILSKLEDDES